MANHKRATLIIAAGLGGLCLAACDRSGSENTSGGTQAANISEPALSPKDAHVRNVAEARTFWKAITTSETACDAIAPFISKAAGRGDVYNLYDNAKIGAENCRSTSDQIKNVSLPEHAPDEVRTALNEALKADADAYADKAESYSRLRDMANGDADAARPSEMANLSQINQETQLYLLKSVIKFKDAFSLEGVTIDEYSGEDSARGHRRHKKRL